MGNVGKRNYFLHIMITAIVVVFCAFSVLFFVENHSFKSFESFDAFEKTLSQMQKDYDVKSGSKTYTLNEDEYILNGNQLYLNAQSLFSYGVIDDLSQDFVLSDEIVSDNVQIIQNENSVDVKWTPNTNRLIVCSNNDVDNFGAVMSAEYNGWHVFQYENENQAKSAYNYYLSLNTVENVCYDVVVHADSVKVQELEEAEVASDVSVNSSTVYKSWGLDYMGFKSYSDLVLTGSRNKIAVAVLDTGINTAHPLFNGRILHEFGKDCTGESSPTRYAYEDLNFHGSHTGGVIVQATDSNVQIIPVKVLDYNGDGYASDIVEGLQYVAKIRNDVAKKGYDLKVVNMSLGLKSTASASVVSSLSSAVNYVYNCGVLPVVSAGNDRKNTVNVCPANVANAVTVSALKKSLTGVLSFDASYSNYGTAVDFCAPGTGIISCNSYYGKYKGQYVSADGTSMAAPHVSAAFALAFSNGNLENNSISAVNKLFEQNAIDIGSDGKDVYYGWGLINLENVALKNVVGEVNFDVVDHGSYKTVKLNYSGEPNYRIYFTKEEKVVSIPPKESDGVEYYRGGEIPINQTTKISATVYIYKDGNLTGQVVHKDTNDAVFSKIIYLDDIDISMNYNVTTDGALIDYYGELETVKIPNDVKGVRVTSITSSAFNGTNVNKVILSEYLTLIGEKAFYYNTKIEEIDASKVSGDITIGNYAFTSCTNLRNINLGANKLIDVGHYAFRYVSKLSNLQVEHIKEIGDYSFADCSGFDRMEFLSIEKVGKYAFSKLSLSKLHLGPNIESIGIQNYLKIQELYGHRGTVAESFAYQNNIEFFDMTLRTARNVNGNSIISLGNNFTWSFVISGQNVEMTNIKLDKVGSSVGLPSSYVSISDVDAHEYNIMVNIPSSTFNVLGNYAVTMNFKDEFNDVLTLSRNIKVVSSTTPTISLEYDLNSHFTVFINGEEYKDSTVLYQGEQYIFEFVADNGYGLPASVKINGTNFNLKDGKVVFKPDKDVTISMDELVRLEKVDANFTYDSKLGSFDVMDGFGEKINANLAKINIGKTLQFKIYPIDGYVVSYVTVNDKALESVNGVYVVGNVNETLNIVIAFDKAVYNINSLSLGKGGTYSKQIGDDSKIRIVANEGYEIEFVMVNGKIVSLIGDTLYLDPGNSDIVISFKDSNGIFGDTSGVAIKYIIVLLVIIVVYIVGRVILYFVLKAQDKKNPKKSLKK